MGIRAHVQVRQPEYGSHTLSSWVQDKAEDFLAKHGVNLRSHNCGDQWEIDIDETLHKVIGILERNRESFDKTLDDEMRSIGYSSDLLNLLKEGVDSAREQHYPTIVIDWF